MNRVLKNSFVGLAAFGGIGALAAGYALVVRPWHLRWGATDEELNESLPGDEIKPEAGVQVTHAVTIDAPAETVWKWLVQIGQGRGGFYSYDWLENVFGLQIQNAREIKSEWQELAVGDFVRSAHKGWLGGRFDDKAGWFVVHLEPQRALVLRDEIEKGSWAFVLKPIAENQTRLLIRIRGDEATNLTRKILNYAVFEPAHFIMERKMLLTLKQRAEEFARAGKPEISQPELLENAPDA
jgi:hypothetical protein